MDPIRVKAEELQSYCERVFEAYGFVPEEAKVITDVLMAADLSGVDSHGSQRLKMYRSHIKAGFIQVGNKPETVYETPISAVVDGNRTMGQLVGKYAMEIAIDKAKKSGIGMVTVRNSNHYGIAGYYSMMATGQGLIGVSMTNSIPIVVPTFGKTPMMGTNPIAVSFPAKPVAFNFDIATSVVALGKVEVKNKQQAKLPLGWGVNEEGKDEQEPKRLIDCVFAKTGGIHPLGGGLESSGGHKGYGLSLIVEYLTGVLSLGLTSNHVQKDGVSGLCHYFMAIDPNLFGDAQAIEEKWNRYLQELRESDRAYGQDRIYIHGEKEEEAIGDRTQNGVPILPKTLEEMKSLADHLEIEFGISLP